MYNIYYKEKAINSLKRFIDSYKESFINLIKDSGLYGEEKIIDNYISLGNILYSNILDEIDKKLIENIILGRINNNSIYITVNNFRLQITYSEIVDKKERYIENINFYKK